MSRVQVLQGAIYIKEKGKREKNFTNLTILRKQMNAILNSIMTYFKGVRAEWGKITWPERAQVFAETLFVVVIITVFTLAVYCLDVVFKWGLSFIPGR